MLVNDKVEMFKTHLSAVKVTSVSQWQIYNYNRSHCTDIHSAIINDRSLKQSADKLSSDSECISFMNENPLL